MTPILNKKIYISVVVVLVFLVLLFVYIKKSPSSNQPPVGNEQPTPSNRDLAIKEVLNNTNDLQERTIINRVSYILTGYKESIKENKPGRNFGGILVFKIEKDKPVLFWESEEYINTGKVAEFRDINNDGISEIVWEYDLGVTGQSNAFYVYKFIDSQFKLITPLMKDNDPVFRFTTLSGDSNLSYMKDIDGDKTQEIVVGYRDEIGIRNIQIYKFNGQVYELWKEEKLTPNDPNP